MAKLYSITEHDLIVTGEKETLLDLVTFYETVQKTAGCELPNIWADLIYSIKMKLVEDFQCEVEGGTAANAVMETSDPMSCAGCVNEKVSRNMDCCWDCNRNPRRKRRDLYKRKEAWE